MKQVFIELNSMLTSSVKIELYKQLSSHLISGHPVKDISGDTHRILYLQIEAELATILLNYNI